MELLGTGSYDTVKQNHKMLVEESLNAARNRRDEKWTRSIAVGSKEFVENIKSRLAGLAKGRNIQKAEAAYQLRETSPHISYNALLRGENGDIGYNNAYFWDVYE